MNEDVQGSVMGVISGRRGYKENGRSKYRVGDIEVHARFCSTDAKGLPKFKFNMNPNTLSADYGLWICGRADSYYLIPVRIISTMYSHPDAYVDRHHQEIRVVSLDTLCHRATYAIGGTAVDISQYHRVLLP